MSEELSPSQAAARIGATTRSVQRWIANGSLPARRVGGRWRVASDALVVFTPVAARPGTAPSVISTVFIANRGEIARRIRATTDRLGIRAVVPGEDGAASVDLLDIEAVVAAALACGADALHPGYGFLAENAAAAAATEAAGIRWVGPSAAAIEAVGDKSAARRLAKKLGVPTLPGYEGPGQSDMALARAAHRIGLPLMVKPAAGGGGKGMHVVRTERELAGSLAAARREAVSAFGDDRLVIERFLEGPRHIEIQVLFDALGDGIHLGERECSLQRRHQKILEETPSSAIDEPRRRAMADAALRLARAVGYRNAGTCEFLVDDREGFFFLEMNTRLQVEHPVTEAVTGRDLVADQLAIAAGGTLASIGLDQATADRARLAGGHAVEVRLYAEDAEDGFLPAIGRVELLRWPAEASRFVTAGRSAIRIDAGIDDGTEVGPRFDPMLAKIVSHGRDRAESFAGLSAALDDTVILGLTTNLRFLRWLVREPAVRSGATRIDTLDRVWPPDDWAARTAIPDGAWSAAARALIDGPGSADPFAGGWRLNGPRAVRLSADGEERMATPGQGDLLLVRIGDTVHLDLAGRSTVFRLAGPPDVDGIARGAGRHGPTGGGLVVAPMPGLVLAIHVARGDTVEAGDPVATLEAMKMEHVVAASIGGVVGDVSARPAEQVVRGQTLATIEPLALP